MQAAREGLRALGEPIALGHLAQLRLRLERAHVMAARAGVGEALPAMRRMEEARQFFREAEPGGAHWRFEIITYVLRNWNGACWSRPHGPATTMGRDVRAHPAAMRAPARRTRAARGV